MRTNWISQKYTSDTKTQLRNVTSLTLYNSGNSKVFFRYQWLKPEQIYVLEGDGSATDIDFEIAFEGGKGEVILNYRSLKKC